MKDNLQGIEDKLRFSKLEEAVWYKINEFSKIIKIERTYLKNLQDEPKEDELDLIDDPFEDSKEILERPEELKLLDNFEYVDNLRDFYRSIDESDFIKIVENKGYILLSGISISPDKFNVYFNKHFSSIIALRSFLGMSDKGLICQRVEQFIRKFPAFKELNRERDRISNKIYVSRNIERVQELDKEKKRRKRANLTPEQKEIQKKRDRERVKKARDLKKFQKNGYLETWFLNK